VDDPAPYLASAEWLRDLGDPLLTFVEPTAVGGSFERRVLFETGEEVDFAVFPGYALDGLAADPGAAATIRRGFRLLAGDDAIARQLESVVAAPEPPPARDDLAELSNEFWYRVLWAAKKLRRGEIWVARLSCEGNQKSLIVRLTALHAAVRRPGLDTWHQGRFFERWADPELLTRFEAACVGYGVGEVERGLRANADLFERLERETAAALGVEPPVRVAEVRRRLDDILDTG
jgi:aminoglycoside 6-adenylyltransferase